MQKNPVPSSEATYNKIRAKEVFEIGRSYKGPTADGKISRKLKVVGKAKVDYSKNVI
ncbi:hypothetical protein DNHGIG_35850 [Collibacillus ludicampi]|jgi:hypothetical protein|uniref:Uncharacterized protein n=1 Tax=Collibacillus ludicampi TaxID=2771369 RepID=A0AAV4LJV7_9BACL|nr:hypothetical protein [Collibacillus ludicampi]GIM48036.1 hypothetical protein DNHGIG_35850 [Collibacillus ludicampi]